MKTFKNIAVTILFGLFFGCAGQTSVIQGTVQMRTDSEAHINIGSDDGIVVGDTLIVYHNENPSGTYTRPVRTGEVKVIKILDPHHAAVSIIYGGIYERDVVEKK